jgi:AcrR family transcriptional regulator
MVLRWRSTTFSDCGGYKSPLVRESKIDLIYREASRLFSRFGYDGVSMRDIANACHITMASLYYHFSSKGELHDEITQACFEDFVDLIHVERSKLSVDNQTPSALLGLIFNAVLANSTLFNLMQHDLHYFGNDDRYKRSRQRYRVFTGLIRDAYRDHHGGYPSDGLLFSSCAFITGYCELIQADERAHGPGKRQFFDAQRSGLVDIARQLYD